MSEQHGPVEPEPTAPDLGDALGLSMSEVGGHRGARAQKRAGSGCLLLVVLIALMGGVAYVGLTKGVDWARDQFAAPADYPGPGSGTVLIEVAAGDTADQIGVTLRDAGVVKSAQAYIDYARSHGDASAAIQIGFYEVKKEMAAADAFAVLADPDNKLESQVTIPEGLRVDDILPLLAKATAGTDHPYDVPAFRNALKDVAALGLPAYANGNAEGYLFPATYAFAPDATPADMLRAMVDRWKQAAADNDLEAKAAAIGKTPAQIMIIASLVQAEGRGDDMPKIARVIYNRLDGPGTKGGTYGMLGIDASNAYGVGKTGTTALTASELARDTPYDTRRRAGLPPTPISAPGDAAIQAATHPATGGWYFYVTVNLKTGETKFAETHEEFLRYKAEYEHYCATESERC